MSGTQHSWNQGQSDAQKGKGPSKTSGMSDTQRKAYDAGYNSSKK